MVVVGITMTKYVARLVFVLALSLFVLSFSLPVVNGPTFGRPDNGWGAFLFCLDYLFEGVENHFQLQALIACASNPCALISFVAWLASKWRLAAWSAYLALVLATPIQVSLIWESSPGSPEFFGPGYWLWLSSFVVQIIASCIAMARDSRT
jgi:hypothetical protein